MRAGQTSTLECGSYPASLIQIDVCPRILEHLQPWAGFPCELIVWLIAHLHRSETAFWVWHHDGGAAVACGEASGACRGTVWVGWIHFRCFAVEVNVPGCDLIAGEALLEVARSAEVGAAFAMGDGDWEEAAFHAFEEYRRALHNLNVTVAGFELLGAVTLELWPALGTRNDLFELRDHLAAVADA